MRLSRHQTAPSATHLTFPTGHALASYRGGADRPFAETATHTPVMSPQENAYLMHLALAVHFLGAAHPHAGRELEDEATGRASSTSKKATVYLHGNND
ncbi:hypothetical protein LshimejAT787_0308260 [Lyophyllum shimeji]|uniref:Uncharacterized protein n=1 Tax=Lyophyllum shimeji TaxID=47721 RepID=A0A9P3PIF2_LYOSH|nr:hypothetical protein LshimejAT787_0308260 [Lyophyllum shimeji]